MFIPSLLLAGVVLPLALFSATAAPSGQATAQLLELSAASGSAPFAGDRRLLTTISPNGDGIRDRAAIRIRLRKPATVTLTIAKTARRATPFHARMYRLRAGRHTLYWAPPAKTPARTYLAYLRVNGRTYGTRDGGPRRRQETPVIRVLGVEAAFARDSYGAASVRAYASPPTPRR